MQERVAGKHVVAHNRIYAQASHEIAQPPYEVDALSLPYSRMNLSFRSCSFHGALLQSFIMARICCINTRDACVAHQL